MDIPVQAGLVVGGLLIGLAGIHIERVAVMLVGFVPGALAGASLAPQLATNTGDVGTLAVTAVVAVVAGAIGAQLAWSVWVLVHAVPGFVAGVVVTAPVVGVSTTDPTLGPETAVVLAAGLAGAVLAWAIHRVFVAVLTAGIGSAMVNVAVLGESVYLPAGRALLRRPEAELRLVVESARDLGAPFLGLAAVFAVVQVASLAASGDGDASRE